MGLILKINVERLSEWSESLQYIPLIKRSEYRGWRYILLRKTPVFRDNFSIFHFDFFLYNRKKDVRLNMSYISVNEESAVIDLLTDIKQTGLLHQNDYRKIKF